MTPFSLSLLSCALFLLLFPRSWLRFGKGVAGKAARRYNVAKVERDPYDRTVKPLNEAAKPRNWIDFFRALIGAVAAGAALAESFEGRAFAGWMALTLAASVLAQMVRVEGRLSLFAPIFFLQGLGVAVLGPVAGLLAMVGAWALSPVLPTAGLLLVVQGGLSLCLGYLISNTEPLPALTIAAVTWMPPLVAILLRKRLAASLDKKLKVIPRDAYDHSA